MRLTVQRACLPAPRAASYLGAGPRTCSLRHACGTGWRRGTLQRCNAAGLGLDSQGNFVDYYEILGVPDGATEPEIKRAYRQLAKACHPDYTGEAGHNMCILLNEAYDVLTNPAMRRVYDEALDSHLEDEGAGFTGKPMSKVVKNGMSKRPEGDTRAVFVDENSCIGCKQCVWVAPAMFRIEPEHGRSRVFAQWLNNEEEIETAIDACPVSCIHWVDERQLPYLEYAMAYLVDRVNVGVMMAGQGGGVGDVFDAAARFAIDRERREKEMNEARKWSPAQQAARKKAAEKMRQEMGAFGSAFFSSFVGSSDIAEDVVNAQSPLQEERLKRREEMRERRAKAKGTVKQELDELVRKAKRGRTGATVPVERALVLSSMYLEDNPMFVRY